MRTQVTPVMIIVAAVVLIVVMVGMYYLTLGRKPALSEQPPELIDDPYADQYDTPLSAPPEDGVPVAPGGR